MSFFLIFAVVLVIGLYWVMTQVRRSGKREAALLRPGVAEGLMEGMNLRRREHGLPILEWEENLTVVAENKAVHQLLTGRDEDGWEYPQDYAAMFGSSLFCEMLFMGPADKMLSRLEHQRDPFDGEWIGCGLGVAGGKSGHVTVALVLSREAWQPLGETTLQMALAEQPAYID